MPEPIRPQPRTPTFLMVAMFYGAPFENRAGLYAAPREVAAAAPPGHPPRFGLAAQRLGERDDLSAAAGVSGLDVGRDAADRRDHRGIRGCAGVFAEAGCGFGFGPDAAPQTAHRYRLRVGGAVARVDRSGFAMALGAGGAAAGSDREGDSLRAARRDDRGCDARGEPREGVRVSPGARSHGGGGGAADGAAVLGRAAFAAADDLFHCD